MHAEQKTETLSRSSSQPTCARTHARTHAPNTHKAYKQKYLPAFAVEDHEKHRIFL